MDQQTLLYTSDFARAKAEIEGLDGHVSQHFTDSVFVATLPDCVDANSLTTSTPHTPPDLDELSWLLAVAGVYTVPRRSSGRFADAQDGSTRDFSALTRITQYGFRSTTIASVGRS